MRRLLSLLLLIIALPIQAAPVNFALPDLQGNTVQLSDYRGKWVVVNFWASWCSPCIKELPEFGTVQRQAEQAQDPLQIIGINYEDTTLAETRDFLDSLPPSPFPHLKFRDNDPGLPSEFFIDAQGQTQSLLGLPTTYFIDPEGMLRAMHAGMLTAQQLQQKLAELR